MAVICSLFLVTSLSLAVESPTEQLKPTLGKLIDLLSAPALKGDEKVERRDKIMKTISERFDFREMSQRILGRTWRQINDQERDYFTSLMTKLLENNYVGQLENYSGETIEYIGERVEGDRAQVSTLIESKGAKFPVHYILIMQGEKWMVYDINIEGVSLVRNYRAEFTSIIRKDKFSGLVKVLEEKNKSFE